MSQLLVIGGASTDLLHLADRSVVSAGGAGMYTAMAAHRAGVQVTMFSSRPEPCPEILQSVAGRLTAWIGPVIPPTQLPHFEISYRQGKTEYLKVSLEAEASLTPTMLPADLSKYDLVHVIPLEDSRRQLAFIQACRRRGAKRISAGTWPREAAEQPQVVRAVMKESDYFFMNGGEAEAVFSSLELARTQPGKVLFVTLAAQGARVIQGQHVTAIPAVAATQIDPTGAGDTFCGATLAYLLQHLHPVMAALQAASLAAEMIAQVGPAALLSEQPPPGVPLDERVQLNDVQLRQVARQISTLAEATPFPFVSPELPPPGHPQALDYFFAATLQQFSFWSERNEQYYRPLIAGIGGVKKKGSDYLWEAYRRRLESDSDFCAPQRQSAMRRESMLTLFRADNGQDPMPALELHLEQARQYGHDMLALQLTPQTLLKQALASTQPLPAFLELLDHIGGYKEDPLRKKSSLLAMILSERPENFLPLKEGEQVAPVIDYHLMRSCLRVGLIDVVDQALEDRLRQRRLLTPAEEWAVRYASYRAIEKVSAMSGKGNAAVDTFFFGARQRCPEMSEPECGACQLDPVCAHRKALFQPVLRTTFY